MQPIVEISIRRTAESDFEIRKQQLERWPTWPRFKEKVRIISKTNMRENTEEE